MVAIIAKMKIKEGKIEEAVQLFKNLVPKVREEEGTLAYAICRDKANQNQLTVIERYRDMEAIQAHSSSAYFKQFSKEIGQLLDGKPELYILDEVVAI
jgi:quinol monooxygenase YgiN